MNCVSAVVVTDLEHFHGNMQHLRFCVSFASLWIFSYLPFTDWETLATWLNEWLSDWMIEWLSDWLTDCLTEWLSDWMTKWPSEWITEWLSDWVTEWLSDWVNEWLIDCLTEWLSDWMTKWLSEWLSDCLTEWLSDWMTKWPSEWLTEWLNDWVTVWLSDWVTEWLSDWVTDWMTEWLSDWMNDWLSDCLAEWLTPYSRVLENLTDSDLVREFYRTQKFHYRVEKSMILLPILSQLNPVHSSVSCYHSIFAQVFQAVSFLQTYPLDLFVYFSWELRFSHAPRPSHPFSLITLYYIWWSLQVMKTLTTKIFPSYCCFLPYAVLKHPQPVLFS